jgi:hypothetical protein
LATTLSDLLEMFSTQAEKTFENEDRHGLFDGKRSFTRNTPFISRLNGSEFTHQQLTNPFRSPIPPEGRLCKAHDTSSHCNGKLRVDGLHHGNMITRMQLLRRGDRMLPPCDRCRRLQMECIKNLMTCVGCTKKHAKCLWRDVREGELETLRNESLQPVESNHKC